MVGIDLVKIDRIKNIYLKYGDKFLNKIFNGEEIEYLQRKNFNAESIAGMYATKEAVSKSLNTGIGKTTFKDIKIFHKNNSPYAVVKNEVFSVSISHDGGFAVSVSVKSNNKNILKSNNFKGLLGTRNKNTHKGNYGKVAVIAGSRGMCGSAYLSSNAALRCGSGLVYNIVPNSLLDIMSIKYIEPIAKSFNSNIEMIGFLKELDAIGIGPGMGVTTENLTVLEEVLNLKKPIVIDADGLNLLSKNLELLKKRENNTTVITPHTGEFARLINKSTSEIESNREKYATDFSREYGCILLLKGNKTIVTDGREMYVNESGNPGMATAGAGDVLTGVITSLLGRKLEPYVAASAGCYIHGLAGDLAKAEIGEESIIASDILNKLSHSIAEII